MPLRQELPTEEPGLVQRTYETIETFHVEAGRLAEELAAHLAASTVPYWLPPHERSFDTEAYQALVSLKALLAAKDNS